MPIGYFAPATDVLWRLLSDSGVDPQALFAEFGIDESSLRDPAKRLPFTTVAALWARVGEVLDEPCLGLRSADFLFASHLGALGHAWLASSNLCDALLRAERYGRMLSDHRELTLEPGPHYLRVLISHDSLDVAAVQRADSVLAALQVMCRWRAGEQFCAARVQLRHAPLPACAQRYRQLFGCEVEFDAAQDSLWIDNEVAQRALPGGDPQLARINEDYLCSLVAGLDRSDLLARAKTQILAQLPSGRVHMAQVATALHLSSRTLQRRLGALGTSFSGVMDDVRREMTLELLQDPRRSLTDIAFSTGFSSLSSFSAAVRHWTGQAPSQVRSTAD